ncbi:hypothetical protein AB4Z18_13800 [Leifsonia sp. 2TAF2]|uniref:hypothetical protein n=1 Tax=Leifsonia sp. 2TAF2 TaxID=3233009 RepID=UPI003F9A7EB8
MDDQTTPTQLIEALPDGSMQATSSIVPQRAKVSGLWTDIDTSLRATDDGWLAPRVTAAGVKFTAGGSSTIAQVQSESGQWFTETWPYGKLPRPTVSGSHAIYPGVFPGVDLRLTATNAGMSEVLIVKTAEAAKNRKLADLTLAVQGAVIEQKAGTRTLTAATKSGEPVASATPLWWDSSEKSADADSPGADEPTAVPMTSTDSSVALKVQQITATNPTYPLYIDPDWSSYLQADWYTDRAFPDQHYLDPPEDSVGYGIQGGVGYLSRAFFQFQTDFLSGKIVSSAHFNITQTYANSCDTTLVQLWEYGGSTTPGFSWNQEPNQWWQAIDQQGNPYGGPCAPNATRVGFTATHAAQSAAANRSAYIQLGLRIAPANEGNQYTRKHYRWDASLTVTYDTIPNTPGALKYTSPPRTCSTDKNNPTLLDSTQPITLADTVGDADAGQGLTTFFGVHGITNTGFATTKSFGPSTSTAAAVSFGAGAFPPGDYRWDSQTNDNTGGVSPVSVSCYFRTTNASPSIPTITQTSTAPPVVGAPMTVQLGGAASDGAVLFAYWWAPSSAPAPAASPALTPVVENQPLPPCNSASGPVRYACPVAGSLKTADLPVAPIDSLSTLWVVSYNQAGRPSLDSSGRFSTAGLAVSANDDNANVSTTNGHIWDSAKLATSATAVPDLNVNAGSVGTTTRQLLGGPLTIVNDRSYRGIPTSFLSYSSASTVSTSERQAVDTKGSFTVSAYLYLDPLAPAGAHVAVSEYSSALSQSADSIAAFTLGTDVNGNAQFCRTIVVTRAKGCATASATSFPTGKWTLLTGIWDSVNQNLRVLTNAQISAAVLTSQPSAANDSSANGALCVGGACTWPLAGSLTTSAPWVGKIARPSVFPGVVSTAQLLNLSLMRAPTEVAPPDTSIGSVVNLRCDQVATPQQMYNFDPNLSGQTGYVPAAGSLQARALAWNGVACRWLRETGNVSLDISVAKIVDLGTMTQLQTAAATGTAAPGIGDLAYFSNGQLQVFKDQYWVVIQYPWATEAADLKSLPADVLSNLP